MRTIGASLSAHIAGAYHKRCEMLRLDLDDGTSIGITSHDQDLTYDGVGASLTYSAGTGVETSDITLLAGLEASSFEVTGPVDATFTLATLLGGRFHRARARLFQVNWSDLTQGHIPLFAGNVTEVRVEGGRFTFEVRSDADRLNQTIGDLITPYCRAKRSTCCVEIGTETATTLAAIVDDYHITVAAAIADPTLFEHGRLWFTSGALSGTRGIEIVSGSGSTFELFAPLPGTPTVGDSLTIKEGCDRTREMCRDRFDNAINFEGFPEVPGTDQVLKVPVPGA